MPACGAPVGMDSVIPETPPEPEEPVAAAHEPDEPSSESAPEPSLPHDWNLGEPMHRVFWFCLAAPDRVPLATMFRSLRWVFSGLDRSGGSADELLDDRRGDAASRGSRA